MYILFESSRTRGLRVLIAKGERPRAKTQIVSLVLFLFLFFFVYCVWTKNEEDAYNIFSIPYFLSGFFFFLQGESPERDADDGE